MIQIDYTSPWPWIWFGWFIYFAIVEGMALFNSTPGDTLSEHVWAWFGTRKYEKPTGWAKVRRVMLGAFLLWLGIHFMTGGQYV